MERREQLRIHATFLESEILNSGLRERRARILVAIGNHTGRHVTIDLSDPPLMGLNKFLTSLPGYTAR